MESGDLEDVGVGLVKGTERLRGCGHLHRQVPGSGEDNLKTKVSIFIIVAVSMYSLLTLYQYLGGGVKADIQCDRALDQRGGRGPAGWEGRRT